MLSTLHPFRVVCGLLTRQEAVSHERGIPCGCASQARTWLKAQREQVPTIRLLWVITALVTLLTLMLLPRYGISGITRGHVPRGYTQR